METVNWTQVIVQLVVMLGAVFTGIFALVQYFLKHLEKKDGHMERTAKEFAETTEIVAEKFHSAIMKQSESYRDVANSQARGNDIQEKTNVILTESNRLIGRNIEVLNRKA